MPGFAGGRGAGDHVVRAGAVKFFGLLERGIVAFALLRHDVQHDRLVAVLGELERSDQQRKVVTVDRAEITQAHFLEDQAAAETAAAVGPHVAGGLFERHFGHGAFERFLRLVAQFQREVAFWYSPDPALEILVQPVVATGG